MIISDSLERNDVLVRIFSFKLFFISDKFTYVVQVICEAAMPGSQLSNSVPEETHNKVS